MGKGALLGSRARAKSLPRRALFRSSLRAVHSSIRPRGTLPLFPLEFTPAKAAGNDRNLLRGRRCPTGTSGAQRSLRGAMIGAISGASPLAPFV
ncbi:MAG: hypothetical protein DME20_00420 [Verrucomicrobia bacterium]|nr:MAG: hypothetical protein DME20_00420 [Verrucomicrobiota bacterium]